MALDFFKAIKNGEIEPYTSSYVVEELEDAPEPKRSDMTGLIEEYNIKVLYASEEIDALAGKYIAQNDGIPKSRATDAQHIASATVNSLDFCVSCNFKHINKKKTKNMVNYVNEREGYKPIFIARPEEVVPDEN
jgi:hypothetical protein